MSDYYNDAIYGYTGGPSLGADMMNPNASDSFDWGAVLMNGIRGAAQGAIASQVRGAYDSGQLVSQYQVQQAQQQASNRQLMMLLLIGGVIFAVTRS